MTRTRAVHLSVHSLSPVAPSAILSHLGTLPYLTLGTHHVSHPLHTRQRRDVAWLLFHRVVYYCQSVVSNIDTNRFRFGARALPNHIHAASETARYSCRTSRCSCSPTTFSYLTEFRFFTTTERDCPVAPATERKWRRRKHMRGHRVWITGAGARKPR